MAEFRKFIASKPFIYCVAAFCFLMWFFEFELIGFIVLIGFICFVLVSQKELTPVLPIAILGMTGVSLAQLPLSVIDDPRFANDFPATIGISILAILLVALIASIIIHFVRFKHERSEDKYPIYIPFFVATASMVLGGLFSKEPYFVQSLLIVAYFILLIFVIVLVRLSNPRGDKLKYFASIAIAFALVSSLEILAFYSRVENIADAFVYKQIDLGWSPHNVIATFLPPAIFMSVYMFSRTQNICYLIISKIVFVATIFTVSRGVIFLTGLTLPIAILLEFKYAKRKWMPLVVILGFIVIMYTSYMIFKDDFKQIYERISYFDNSGRTPLRIMFEKLFAQNPFFGIGFFIPTDAGTMQLINPHMVFIEILTSCGIVGFFAFSWFLYEMFRVIFTQKSRYNLFLILAFIVYFGYGLADPTLWRVPQHFIMIVLLQGSRRELDSEGKLKLFQKLDEILYKSDARVIISLGVGLLLSITTFLLFGLSGYEKFLFGKETYSYILGSAFSFLSIATVPPAFKKFVGILKRKDNKIIS